MRSPCFTSRSASCNHHKVVLRAWPKQPMLSVFGHKDDKDAQKSSKCKMRLHSNRCMFTRDVDLDG